VEERTESVVGRVREAVGFKAAVHFDMAAFCDPIVDSKRRNCVTDFFSYFVVV